MKTAKSSLILLSLFSTLLFASCSTKLNFLTSSVVPAAKGVVTIDKDANSNYAIKVKVTNLAEPTRLQPKKELYLVWLVTKEKVTKNIGRLNSSTGFFSSTLEGQLNTTSPFKPDYIFITAEDTADLQNPLGTVVLTTRIN